MRTKVVGANLESLLLAHEQPDLSGFLALQQPDLPNAALLPFARVIVKAVQLALAASTCTAHFRLKGELLVPQHVEET